MPKFKFVLVFWIVCLIGARLSVAADRVDYARDVLPILSDNCYHCHGPDEKARKAKLRLDTKEGAFRVKDDVAVLVAGKPDQSELVKRITSKDPDERMPPPEGIRKLTPKQIETLKEWVAQGAKWGTHWAFVPPARPALPQVKQKDWVRNEIDRVVLARLEKEGLSPQQQADRERLIRRVSFDLTGLPPTPAEIDAFVGDKSPDAGAYERLVDRLLASPRYGERMASEWMDVARFADTHGYQMDRFRSMTPYRDWIIRAYNANLPFDQFLTWQLAGDLLPNATKDQRLATAFNRLHCQNEEGGIVEEEFRVAYVVDRVNTMGTAFLGMTFECCRCHDHKYDPISQKDFYSLFSFFQNIDESGQTTFFTSAMPVPTMLLSTDEQDAKLEAMEKAIAQKTEALWKVQAAALGGPFDEWIKTQPNSPEPEFRGCVGHYPLDGEQKNQVRNLADAKHPGKVVESPEFVEHNGHIVASLSGENGFHFPGIGHFSRIDPFSLSIWISPGEIAERQVVLHHSKAPIDAGSRGYELLLENGHVAFGMHHMWPGDSLKVSTQKAIAKGEWAHITVTYDGSSKAEGVRIYLNGVGATVDVVKDDLYKDILYGGGEPELAIGYRFRDNGFRNGKVADLRVFNRDVSPYEALSLAGNVPQRPTEFHRGVLQEYFASAISSDVARAREELHAARKAHNDLVDRIPEAMVMKEMGKPKPAYVLKRGNYDQHAEEVTADTPHAMPPFPKNAPHNRLSLAQWLCEPKHPLTARVTVNRLWQQMFGRGLVETTENFGSTGAVPSDPELLDHLARVFVDDFHWDQKKLLRYIALSATYQQSSKASPELLARDPHNELLARGPARRLTAEMLRDQAIFDSGLFVEKLGGPSVKPYQPAGLWEIAMGRPTYDQGHGEALYRRSLYTFVKRTVAPPSMLTFDAGDRSVCTVRRQSTSTPLQSLALLNDVQIIEAARKVSERMLKEGGDNDASRAKWAFRLITGRHATDREGKILTELLAEQRDYFKADADAAKKLLAVGESKADAKLDAVEVATGCVLAQALFNHDEAVMRR